MRNDRGEEALGLVLDQMGAHPAVERLPLRLRWDLIRAGIHARRRGRPPLSVRFTVAYSSRRQPSRAVPATWLPWLSFALGQPSFPARMACYRMVFVVPILVVNFLQSRDPSWWWVPVSYGVIALVEMIWATIRARTFRRRVCEAHGLAPDGSLLAASEAVAEWNAPSMANVGLRRLLGFAAVGAAVSAPFTWTFADGGWAQAPDVGASAAWTFGPAALLVAWLAWVLRSPVAVGPPVIDAPRLGATTLDRRVAMAGSLAAGVGLALACSLLSFSDDVGAIAVAAPALALGAGWALVRSREQRARRWLGVWDALPSSSPQVVVRRTHDLIAAPWMGNPPPPPPSPSS